jgi:hypothetical protein
VATSEIEIVNMALAAAGATRPLTGELGAQTSPEGTMARLYYPQRRDELLSSFPWFFAKRRVTLAPLADVTRTDWTNVYAAPAGMLSARSVVRHGIRYPRPEDEIEFMVEAGDPDSDGEPGALVILCDEPSAELIFIGAITAPVRFSPLFTSALADRLAVDLATYLSKKADLAKAAQERFMGELAQAKVHSASQGQRGPASMPDFLEGSFTGDTSAMERVRFRR